MKFGKKEAQEILEQGVDLNQKEQVDKIKDHYNRVQIMAEVIEHECITRKLTQEEIIQSWNVFLERQNKQFTSKQLIQGTKRPELRIVDQRTGQPLNIK